MLSKKKSSRNSSCVKSNSNYQLWCCSDSFLPDSLRTSKLVWKHNRLTNLFCNPSSFLLICPCCEYVWLIVQFVGSQNLIAPTFVFHLMTTGVFLTSYLLLYPWTCEILHCEVRVWISIRAGCPEFSGAPEWKVFDYDQTNLKRKGWMCLHCLMSISVSVPLWLYLSHSLTPFNTFVCTDL